METTLEAFVLRYVDVATKAPLKGCILRSVNALKKSKEQEKLDILQEAEARKAFEVARAKELAAAADAAAAAAEAGVKAASLARKEASVPYIPAVNASTSTSTSSAQPQQQQQQNGASQADTMIDPALQELEGGSSSSVMPNLQQQKDHSATQTSRAATPSKATNHLRGTSTTSEDDVRAALLPAAQLLVHQQRQQQQQQQHQHQQMQQQQQQQNVFRSPAPFPTSFNNTPSTSAPSTPSNGFLPPTSAGYSRQVAPPPSATTTQMVAPGLRSPRRPVNDPDKANAVQMRQILSGIMGISKANVKAAEDKVALANTAYDWVS